MHKYKLKIAYDGTHYHGWQIQPNGISIQSTIEDNLAILLKMESLRLIAAGRTDAGVHAKGQVAHFETALPVDCYKLLAGLNGRLPHDIRILQIEEAAIDFHAQYSALGKIYHYHLWLERIIDPFVRLYRYRPLEKLDLNLLSDASKLFLNTKDFTTFANSAHQGSASKNPIRTISRIDIVMQEGGARLEFEGDGFLYKMVRNIVGTLLEVASGYRPITDIDKLFAACDRRVAGKAVPPQGLFLMQVHYPIAEKQG